ncbi:MAG: four helix bundle protein [Chloroflexi bacterium]|nr:four helix bundle protein [Chloroflexota bacterium]
MATALEDLRALQTAEVIADSIWARIIEWDDFAKDTVGKQLARAADSIGANIAESFGRFHYGQKIEFLYYSRGSLFETKYWLNRVLQRKLMPSEEVQKYSQELNGLATGLNVFVKNLKLQRQETTTTARTAREEIAEYLTDPVLQISDRLFSDEELKWIESLPNNQSLDL